MPAFSKLKLEMEDAGIEPDQEQSIAITSDVVTSVPVSSDVNIATSSVQVSEPSASTAVMPTFSGGHAASIVSANTDAMLKHPTVIEMEVPHDPVTHDATKSEVMVDARAIMANDVHDLEITQDTLAATYMTDAVENGAHVPTLDVAGLSLLHISGVELADVDTAKSIEVDAPISNAEVTDIGVQGGAITMDHISNVKHATLNGQAFNHPIAESHLSQVETSSSLTHTQISPNVIESPAAISSPSSPARCSASPPKPPSVTKDVNTSNNIPKPADLEEAYATICHLHVSQDALRTSIDALNVLVATERAHTRVAKRRLQTLTSKPSPPPTALVEENASLRRQLATLAENTEAVDAANLRTDKLSQLLALSEERAEKAVGDNSLARSRLEELERLVKVEEEKVAHLEENYVQVEGKMDVVVREAAEKESSLLEALLDADRRTNDACCRLEVEVAKSVELETRLEELPTLRSRLKELENTASDAVDNSRSETILKKKMLEINIARSVITEKDKLLAELRSNLKAMEQQVPGFRDSIETKELCILDLRKSLADTQTQLQYSRTQINSSAECYRTAEEKLEAMEKDLMHECDMLAEARSTIERYEIQSQEWNRRQSRLESRVKTAELDNQQIMEESRILKTSLDVAEKELIKYTEAEQKNDISEYVGYTSPCSVDADAETRAQPSSSSAGKLRSLADLEEAALTTNVNPQASTVQTQARPSPASESKPIIDSVSRALNSVKITSQERNENLEEAIAEPVLEERALETLRFNLSKKTEECDNLTIRINSELEPTLNSTREKLEEKILLLDEVRHEFKSMKELSEKRLSVMQGKLDGSSNQLQNTSVALDTIKGQLVQSEREVSNLENKVASLKKEEDQNSKKMQELIRERQHRLDSLNAMQQSLVKVEAMVAAHQQSALEANEDKERLEKLLSQACSGQEIAEKRAVRKDDILHELEKRNQELEHIHASEKKLLEEKGSKEETALREINDLKQVLRIKEAALQDQAKISCERESYFKLKAEELRRAISNKESEMQVVKEDLAAVERQNKILGELLASSSSKLRNTELSLHETTGQLNKVDSAEKNCQVKLRNAQEQVSYLKAQDRCSHGEIVARDQRISSQTTTLSEQSIQISSLHVDKTGLEKVIRNLRDGLDFEKSRCESQEADIAKLRNDLSTVSTECSSYKKKFSFCNAEMGSLTSRLSDVHLDLERLENVVVDRDEKIKSNEEVITSVEQSLVQSKEQIGLLKSHLSGHEVLLKDHREKERSIVRLREELLQAKKNIKNHEQNSLVLHGNLTSRIEEVKAMSRRVTSLDNDKTDLEKNLEKVQQSHISAKHSLNSTMQSLAALQTSTSEEIEGLRQTISGLRKDLSEKETSLQTRLKATEHSEIERNIMAEQLKDSRIRGDHLSSKLATAEMGLSSEKESLAALHIRFSEMEDAIMIRNAEVEALKRALTDKNDALSLSHLELKEVTNKLEALTSVELCSLNRKLEAKEKSEANLHNWCSFINGKLRNAEKSLSERDEDLSASSAAYDELKAQADRLDDALRSKQSQLRSLEVCRVSEVSELKSRLHSLKMFVIEANDMVEKSRRRKIPRGNESLIQLTEDLRKSKLYLKEKEMELAEAHALNKSLGETIQKYGQDLTASQNAVDLLTVELKSHGSQNESKEEALDVNSEQDKADTEVPKDSSKTNFLLEELKRGQEELSAAKETMRMWQKKAEELQPMAEALPEAQRAVEILSSKMSMQKSKASKSLGLIEEHVGGAIHEKVPMEREFSGTVTDYSAIRAKLRGSYSSEFGVHAPMSNHCAVTFILTGACAPGAEVMVYILGGDVSLGGWNPSLRVPVPVFCTGENGVIRRCVLVVPTNLSTEYKYAADAADGSLVWESGCNRSLNVQENDVITSSDVWRA